MSDQQRDFFVTLPSGSSMTYFPNNSLTQFTTMLHQPLTLEGSWEVALLELSFPKTFYNVVGTQTVRLTGVDKEETVPEGFYETPGGLVGVINRLIKLLALAEDDMRAPVLYYRSTDSRIRIQPGKRKNGEDVYPHFSPEFAALLGRSGDGSKRGYGEKGVKLMGRLHTLFVECDICTPSFCTDGYAQLLRAVRVPAGTYGETVSASFHPALYIPLLRHNFRTITLYIRDEDGQPVQFQRGRVLATLHFRPVRK